MKQYVGDTTMGKYNCIQKKGVCVGAGSITRHHLEVVDVDVTFNLKKDCHVNMKMKLRT